MNRTTALFLIGSLALLGCTEEAQPPPQATPELAPPSAEPAASELPVLELKASDYAFEFPSEQVPAGWVTVEFENVGAQEHFAYFYRLPDGVSFEQHMQETLIPFGEIWNRYEAGELSRGEAWTALHEDLPQWFFEDVRAVGGVGLTEPGSTAVTTVHFEPGTYVVECYVKAPNGQWHTAMGMIDSFEVAPGDSGAAPPAADARIEIFNDRIDMPETLPAGEQVIAVTVSEAPSGLLQHDLHLFRLDEATLDQLIAWMDWMDFEQYRAPTPGHSLGGVAHLSEGGTNYLHLSLEPGRYALVSEEYGSEGVVAEFEVR